MNTSALELVHNGPVIDAMDLNLAAIAFVIQAPAVFANAGDTYSPHPEHTLGKDEVGQCLLMQRIDLHQDDIIAIVAAQDGAAEQSLIPVHIQAAEQIPQAAAEAIGVDIDL